MGAYATTTSLPQLMPFFLKQNTTTADADGVAIFAKHIDRAEGVVNAAVTAKYSLPITPTPPILITLTEDIACYYATRGAYTQDGQNKNEYMTEYKSAMDILKQIIKGDIKLSLTDGSLVPVNSSSRFLASTENYTPIFGLDDPTEWQRDPNEIDDQARARAG